MSAWRVSIMIGVTPRVVHGASGTCAASICTTDSDYPGVFLSDEGAKKIISFVCVFAFLLFINRQEKSIADVTKKNPVHVT